MGVYYAITCKWYFYLFLWGLWQIITLYFHDFFASHVESKVKKNHIVLLVLFLLHFVFICIFVIRLS